MAINLPGGFNITNVDPIDARFSVRDEAARLGFSSANVYEGLVVYQQNTSELYVLIDISNWDNSLGWQLVGSGVSSPVPSYIATGSVTASVDLFGASIFLVKSGSNNFFSISDTGQTTIAGPAEDLFIIKGSNDTPILTVSQSGVITLATHSVELTSPAPYGGMYFTSNSLYIGVD